MFAPVWEAQVMQKGSPSAVARPESHGILPIPCFLPSPLISPLPRHIQSIRFTEIIYTFQKQHKTLLRTSYIVIRYSQRKRGKQGNFIFPCATATSEQTHVRMAGSTDGNKCCV